MAKTKALEKNVLFPRSVLKLRITNKFTFLLFLHENQFYIFMYCMTLLCVHYVLGIDELHSIFFVIVKSCTIHVFVFMSKQWKVMLLLNSLRTCWQTFFILKRSGTRPVHKVS